MYFTGDSYTPESLPRLQIKSKLIFNAQAEHGCSHNELSG